MFSVPKIRHEHSEEETQTLNDTTSRKKNSILWQMKRMQRHESSKGFPRLIPRNEPFHQSKNRVSVLNRSSPTKKTFSKPPFSWWCYRNNAPCFPWEVFFMARENWYHMFLRWRIIYSSTLLMASWFLSMMAFAALYVYVDALEPDRSCGLGEQGEPISFYPALAFSLETASTVGYGLPNNTNGFFEPECRLIQACVYFQMIWSMVFTAFLTAFIFSRLARCEQRGVQVMFADKAVIDKKDGRWLLSVRYYDLDSRLPIVEAHIRMYCVSWNDYNVPSRQNAGQPHLLHTMRIEEPNDELNGMVFTGVPMNATHALDPFSPLVPMHLREELNLMKGHGLILRQADMLTGSLSSMPCPICGETFETPEQLKAHIDYFQILEQYNEPPVPIEGTHRDPKLITPKLTKKFELTKEMIIENFKDKEIVVVLEGIEPMHSGTFQALHSYRLEDIAFDARFAPCMSRTDTQAYVDLDDFHRVVYHKEGDEEMIHDDGDYNTFQS